ncbi:hypothetical protein CANCADRAFT_2400 [Tortispora caseinolytica NRRL Y-17796]|uniref:arginyltransferase n=1 Tax=Tortispora caseinolytica NRRL Y-17796 TaxID=767744 RepID=A0A1E4TFY6_9ASCO|nr:hypothetical protein CANCADRAFT_2400 [Tortispora caseinolytica NRRL Y-17796]
MSILTLGRSDVGHCGYCNKNSSAIFGLIAKDLVNDDYMTLMDSGFRRSGDFLYKPNMNQTCCPQFTIRANVINLKPTKDYRKALNRLCRFAEVELPVSKEYKYQKTVDALMKSSKLTITLEPSSFTDEKFSLYALYEQEVHSRETAELRRESFKRFLCDTPFSEPTCYHHVYRLDGRLIAVSVLDVLPNALSAVYFFWHPDMRKLELGKVSTLIESQLTSEMGFTYYYLGYYIPTCPKMQYKAQLKPCELLDPSTNEFKSFEDVDLNPPFDIKDDPHVYDDLLTHGIRIKIFDTEMIYPDVPEFITSLLGNQIRDTALAVGPEIAKTVVFEVPV